MSSGMPKFLIVARQEFLNGIRSRWFIFGTIVAPLMMLGLISMAVFLAAKGGDKPSHLVIFDETRTIYPVLAKQFTDKFADGRFKIQLDEGKVNNLVNIDEAIATLKKNVINRDIDGYVVVPEDFLTAGNARLYALSVSNFELNTRLQLALSNAVREHRLREAGLDGAKIAQLLAPANLATFRVSAEGEKADKGGTFALVYVLVMLLYSTVVLYGNSISRSIVEEKVSRIVEVMLSSLRPFQLLAGKVLGVGLVGLCQMSVWCIVGMTTLGMRKPFFGLLGTDLPGKIALPDFPPSLAASFVIWFILGYFLFALLYAMVASLSGSEQEAQQLQFPVVMLLVVPLISIMPIINYPESGYSVAMSMVPFFAPIVMFMRTAVLTPPWTQIAASMGICMLTILLELWMVAKIYRIGILSYGKRPRFREIARWIFSS